MGEFSFPRLVVFCLLLTSLYSNLFLLFLLLLINASGKEKKEKEKKGREVGGLPVNVLSFKRGQRPFVSSPTLPPNATSIPLPLVRRRLETSLGRSLLRFFSYMTSPTQPSVDQVVGR